MNTPQFSNFHLTSDVCLFKISGDAATARTAATFPNLSCLLRVVKTREGAPRLLGILADSSHSPNPNLPHRALSGVMAFA